MTFAFPAIFLASAATYVCAQRTTGNRVEGGGGGGGARPNNPNPNHHFVDNAIRRVAEKQASVSGVIGSNA